jgi:hypothetical protein
MRKGFIALVAAVLLTTGVRQADAASILVYQDFVVGTSQMTPALAGHTVTTATDPTNFAALLGGGGFQLAMFFQQNSSGSDYDAAFAAIATFLAGGGAAIAADWTATNTHAAAFGASFTGTNNNPTVTVTSGGLLPGVTNPFDLINPGWGVYSTGLTAGGGAICGATFANGQCAIVIGLGGKAIFNGFLTDTPSDSASRSSPMKSTWPWAPLPCRSPRRSGCSAPASRPSSSPAARRSALAARVRF